MMDRKELLFFLTHYGMKQQQLYQSDVAEVYEGDKYGNVIVEYSKIVNRRIDVAGE